MRGAWLVGFGAAFLSLSVTSARAEDGAAAQVLFDEGKARMAAGDFAVACAKLEDSYRLQPAGGTVMHLALCREAEGKTATAWLRFNETLSAARRDGRADREKVAQDHLASLGPKLVKLTIVVPEGVAATAGLDVQRDGEPIAKPAWGTAVPVDPGKHKITATGARKKLWAAEVEVAAEGAAQTVEIPSLEDDPNAPLPLGATPASTSRDDPGHTRRVAAVVVGAVGLVGVGVGAVLGGVALSKKSQESAHCPGGSQGPCDPEGVSLSKDAVALGNVSTIAFGVGAAGLGASLVLWLTAPKATSPSVALSPQVSTNSLGFTLRGGF